MVVIELGDPLVQFVAAKALFDAQVEQVDVGIQRELVHGVYMAHIVQHKEQDGSALGTGAISLQFKHTTFDRLILTEPLIRAFYLYPYTVNN